MKLRQARSVGKKLLIFFVPLEEHTVNSEWYTTVYLPHVIEEVREKRPIASSVILLKEVTLSVITTPQTEQTSFCLQQR